MKQINQMSAEELAGYICHTLQTAGIVVTLTGGACVTIWSQGKYVSYDLDFIEEGPVPRRKIRETLQRLGFTERGRHFVNADTKYFVEFPNGPLTVGNERVRQVAQRQTALGTLRLLSPTDCVKDRLAAFFHWSDRQSLEQAVLVAQTQDTNLDNIHRWSIAEGHEERFRVFQQRLTGGPGRKPPA